MTVTHEQFGPFVHVRVGGVVDTQVIESDGKDLPAGGGKVWQSGNYEEEYIFRTDWFQQFLDERGEMSQFIINLSDNLSHYDEFSYRVLTKRGLETYLGEGYVTESNFVDEKSFRSVLSKGEFNRVVLGKDGYDCSDPLYDADGKMIVHGFLFDNCFDDPSVIVKDEETAKKVIEKLKTKDGVSNIGHEEYSYAFKSGCADYEEVSFTYMPKSVAEFEKLSEMDSWDRLRVVCKKLGVGRYFVEV